MKAKIADISDKIVQTKGHRGPRILIFIGLEPGSYAARERLERWRERAVGRALALVLGSEAYRARNGVQGVLWQGIHWSVP